MTSLVSDVKKKIFSGGSLRITNTQIDNNFKNFDQYFKQIEDRKRNAVSALKSIISNSRESL